MSPILGIWASQISGHLYQPVGSYDSLATITVPSGGVSSISFAGIPTGYRHLQVRALHLNLSSGDYDWSIQFNSDTGANYSKHQLYGTGSSAAATGTASTNQIPGGFSYNTSPGATVFDVLDYASTNKTKTVRVLTGSDNNGSGVIGLRSGAWFSTNAITSIQLIPTSGSTGFGQYSQFALYGVK